MHSIKLTCLLSKNVVEHKWKTLLSYPSLQHSSSFQNPKLTIITKKSTFLWGTVIFIYILHDHIEMNSPACTSCICENLCVFMQICLCVCRMQQQQRIMLTASAHISSFILLLSYIYKLQYAFISGYKILIQAACAEKLFIGHWDRENSAFSSCLIAIYLAYSSVLEIYVLICLRIPVIIYFWK